MKNKKELYQTSYNYIDPRDFWQLVEDQINIYLSSPGFHYLIEKAKNEGWFGSTHNNKDHVGLLGYLRNNSAYQIVVLNKFDNHFPSHFYEFTSFFRSEYFKNRVLKENAVSHNINPTIYNNKPIDYLEVIKNKALFNSKIGE